ncbi:MAG: hypothetical protein ACYC7L_04295 [Nitrospirota bacterium]
MKLLLMCGKQRVMGQGGADQAPGKARNVPWEKPIIYENIDEEAAPVKEGREARLQKRAVARSMPIAATEKTEMIRS